VTVLDTFLFVFLTSCISSNNFVVKNNYDETRKIAKVAATASSKAYIKTEYPMKFPKRIIISIGKLISVMN
jgi:hypothetical protein